MSTAAKKKPSASRRATIARVAPTVRTPKPIVELTYVDEKKNLRARFKPEQWPLELIGVLESKTEMVIEVFRGELRVLPSSELVFYADDGESLTHVRYELTHDRKIGDETVYYYRKYLVTRKKLETSGLVVSPR